MKRHNALGKNLAYVLEEGQGPTLLFLHGFAESHKIWERQIVHFSAKGHSVLAIDLPGFGASDVWPDISIDEMAALVYELLYQENIHSCIVFGHSMGGYVALSLASQFPDCISGMGLIHSHPFADPEERRAARQKSIRFIQETGNVPYLKQLFPTFFAAGFLQNHPEILDHLMADASAFSDEGITAALAAMASRRDLSNVLEHIYQPVLFVLGLEDQLIPPTEAMLSQTALPDKAVIHLLDGIGHMVLYEAPEQLDQILEEFIPLCT